MLLREDSNATLNPGNASLIILLKVACQIEDRFFQFIHSWNSGPWHVLHFQLLQFFYYILMSAYLIVLILAFFGFCSS